MQTLDDLPLRATTKSLVREQIAQHPQHEGILLEAARQAAECGFGPRDAEDHIFGALADAEEAEQGE
jgi:hypothetical protein